MSLISEVLSNMVQHSRDWGVGGLDKTDHLARQGDPVSLSFTTYLMQRDQAEEEEQNFPRFQLDQAIQDCLQYMESKNPQEGFEYLWDRIHTGGLTKDQFVQVLIQYGTTDQ